MKRNPYRCRPGRYGNFSYYIDLTMDELIEVCEDYIELLDDRWPGTGEHDMLGAMEQLKSVIVLFNDPDNRRALSSLNGNIINRCEVTKRRHWETLHPSVVVETDRDSVTLVDHGAIVEFLFHIDAMSDDMTVESIMTATIELKENYRRRPYAGRDSRSTKPKPKAKPKTKVKPTTKGETQMSITPVQTDKPITLSKPSKASDYDLPLRDDLQWLAQNVSKINHHFELASFGQTLHLGKSTDDTPPSFSAKLVVRPTTIVTESTYEVTLIWEDVEYVDGVFRTSRYPEFHSKEVTDFYQLAQQVKHSCSPTISELFYSAAIHLDYQRGGYIVNQDDASDGKKS